MHTSHVSSNICWKSLVRACEVAPDLVQLMTDKWEDFMCCDCWFVLHLLFDSSSSISGVAESVAGWSVAGGGYRNWHMWRHWLLGLVGRLEKWLELYLVPGCRMAPGVGKETVVKTYVQ